MLLGSVPYDLGLVARFFSDLLNLKNLFLAGVLNVKFGACNKLETGACSKANSFQARSQEVAETSLAVEFIIFNHQSPNLPLT